MTAQLVSILIPCYNAGPWLAQTLESALAQTHPRTEIIVVDDGSTDNSPAIARTFAPRGVRLIEQPNAGASSARNHALRESRGDFIQFLDADDLISAGKISAQVEALRHRPAATVCSCRWGRFRDDARFTDFAEERVFRDFPPLDFLTLAASTGAMMHPSAWLVPRAVAIAAGPWDESLSLNDDGEYFCRVLLVSAGIAFCDDPRARSHYRSGLPGSLSQQRGERARISQFRSIELMSGHLRAALDAPSTRRAAANHYQQFIYDFYPASADLIRLAEARINELGGATLGPPVLGKKTAGLARLIGWKNTARLKSFLRS